VRNVGTWGQSGAVQRETAARGARAEPCGEEWWCAGPEQSGMERRRAARAERCGTAACGARAKRSGAVRNVGAWGQSGAERGCAWSEQSGVERRLQGAGVAGENLPGAGAAGENRYPIVHSPISRQMR